MRKLLIGIVLFVGLLVWWLDKVYEQAKQEEGRAWLKEKQKSVGY